MAGRDDNREREREREGGGGERCERALVAGVVLKSEKVKMFSLRLHGGGGLSLPRHTRTHTHTHAHRHAENASAHKENARRQRGARAALPTLFNSPHFSMPFRRARARVRRLQVANVMWRSTFASAPTAGVDSSFWTPWEVDLLAEKRYKTYTPSQ